MKVIFIGLGSIATKHIKDLSDICDKQGIECDITVLRRNVGNLSSDLFSCNIKQIIELDNTIYDVAFITNPTNLHFQILKLLKGKARFYFIEKPIFESSSYEWYNLGITEKNAYVACPLRHSQTYKKLKEIADNNKVFNARIICSSYLPDWRPDIDYRKNYSAIKALGGGVTLDLIHEIDYLVGLFGFPIKMFNIHGKYSNLDIDSDDLSVYVAQYRDKICEVHLDYFGKKYRRIAELFTSKGTFIANFKEEKFEMPDGIMINCSNNGKTNIYSEMEYFMNFITNKISENINPPQNACKVLKIALGE